VVFVAIGTSQVRFIKLFGLGMALAVLMDAFVIRGTLVPAFMRLAGRANWWLPTWLRPLHAKIAIRESVEEHQAEPELVPLARTDQTHPPTAPRKPKPRPKPVSRANGAAKKKKAPARKPAAKRKPTAKKKPAAKRKPTTAKKKAPARKGR
jgi:outer membrane biosynthesis protein TonB